MVFKCHTGNGDVYALKMCFTRDAFKSESQGNSLLKGTDVVIPLIEDSYRHRVFIYPYFKSVVESVWTPPDNVVPLLPIHFQQLYRKLKTMHKKGLVHRDIRPENILISPDGEAFFIDLGFAIAASDTPQVFQGSLVTAAQQVLEYLYSDITSFVYTKNYDLESFYKLYFWCRNFIDFPEKTADKKKYLADLHREWRPCPRLFEFSKHVLSYDDLYTEIESDLFGYMNYVNLTMSLRDAVPLASKENLPSADQEPQKLLWKILVQHQPLSIYLADESESE